MTVSPMARQSGGCGAVSRADDARQFNEPRGRHPAADCAVRALRVSPCLAICVERAHLHGGGLRAVHTRRHKEMREQAPMVMFNDADGNPWVPANEQDDSTGILRLGDPGRLLKRCTGPFVALCAPHC